MGVVFDMRSPDEREDDERWADLVAKAHASYERNRLQSQPSWNDLSRLQRRDIIKLFRAGDAPPYPHT